MKKAILITLLSLSVHIAFAQTIPSSEDTGYIKSIDDLPNGDVDSYIPPTTVETQFLAAVFTAYEFILDTVNLSGFYRSDGAYPDDDYYYYHRYVNGYRIGIQSMGGKPFRFAIGEYQHEKIKLYFAYLNSIDAFTVDLYYEGRHFRYTTEEGVSQYSDEISVAEMEEVLKLISTPNFWR